MCVTTAVLNVRFSVTAEHRLCIRGVVVSVSGVCSTVRTEPSTYFRVLTARVRACQCRDGPSTPLLPRPLLRGVFKMFWLLGSVLLPLVEMQTPLRPYDCPKELDTHTFCFQLDAPAVKVIPCMSSQPLG